MCYINLHITNLLTHFVEEQSNKRRGQSQNWTTQHRVGHGSLFPDPTRPDPPRVGPDPTRLVSWPEGVTRDPT